MKTQEGENEPRKFLAFVTNAAELAPNAAADTGMHSPAAIAMMLKALHTAANLATLKPAERALVKELLHDYRNLFISAAMNKYFGDADSATAHAEHMRRVVLQMAFGPKGGGLFSTGFERHATVTRVAVMDESRQGSQSESGGMNRYRWAVGQELGGVSKKVADSYQLGMTLEQFEDPGIQALITKDTCMLWPGSQPGRVRVSSRDAEGTLQHSEVSVSDLERVLQNSGGPKPISNCVKMTVHNGGAGGVFAVDGTTRSFSNRLTVPLVQTADLLTGMMSAKLQTHRQQADFLAQLRMYDADSLLSNAASPAVQGQTLGNCTVHSQKLAILYHLQHPEERASNLSLSEGTKLFTKIWGGVLNVATSTCGVLLADSTSKKKAESALAKERDWLEKVANPLAARKPFVAATRARAAVPVSQDDSIAVSIEKMKQDARTRRIASRHAEPKRCNAPADILAQLTRVAKIADWDTSGVIGTPDVAALTQWARHDLRGSWWEPSTTAELEGFTRLMDTIKSGMLNSRRLAFENRWLDGGNQVKDAFDALEKGKHAVAPG